ncbi:MAG: methyltransferase domain-containing protein [Simkaniaceae bacterium]|nr:methyltransferase domain-containing protein [Simkaniaceae bacterium]
MRWIIDYFRFARFDMKESMLIGRTYYLDTRFARMDRALLRRYIFLSPYRISKRYLKKHKANDLYTYGETPLRTMEAIAKKVGIRPTDRVLDLGSGRGRAALFLTHFYNCTVIGIERIPQFVKLASHVAEKFRLERSSFIHADFLKADWPRVNVIYLYGLCCDKKEIRGIIRQLKTSQKKVRIITIGYPLEEYDKEESFTTTDTFPASFNWGEGEAFLQEFEAPSRISVLPSKRPACRGRLSQ